MRGAARTIVSITLAASAGAALAQQGQGAGMGGVMGMGRPGSPFMERVEMIDADGDGLIQRAELLEFREGVFYAMVADGDEALSREEYMSVQMGRGADPDIRGPRYGEMQAAKEAEYDAMDPDGDDSVNFQTFTGYAGDQFDAADGNVDGALTPMEFRAMHGR
jgi:hypothetical protein